MEAHLSAEFAPPFVATDSIVRTIWGDADTILLIFAGAAAEFALNRAVDWLFFTGALPRDPVGRLFTTAEYAQQIVFADQASAHHTLSRIAHIHQTVEQQRGQQIPAWAQRDVLYMLIAYSERAYRLHRRSLTDSECSELYAVFRRVGEALGIVKLPQTYAEWQVDRMQHLREDLSYSPLTVHLYHRYREVLGWWRYGLLRAIQGMITPHYVRNLLSLHRWAGLQYGIKLYRVLTRLGLRSLIQRMLIPRQYLAHLQRMDIAKPDQQATERRRRDDCGGAY
jgi:uncharacterized protein (DUF2236 family)